MRRLFILVTMTTVILSNSPAIFADQQLALIPDKNVVEDTYPHISALENAILGQSFPGQPVSQRLERMEQKAFGSMSTNPDLSARTDALDDYTDKELHKKLLHANADEDTADSSQDSAAATPADYPHITSLEQSILGQTYAGQPLTDRLNRMEVKAFGGASVNPDLSARTDALEAYAEKTLHKQPSARPDSDNSDDTAQEKGLLSKVEHALIGAAGGGSTSNNSGGSPGGGGLGAISSLLGLGGMGGFPGGGMGGFPGGGMGGFGSGMGGGGRGRQAMQQQQEQEPAAPVRQEDPAIYEATPPDPSARLLVKVGWCEVKVFGHPFPDMHLPQRLGQLNNELHLETGKSNVQLMDDIGLMIKTVQARTPLAQHNVQESKTSN